jgi:ribosomal protein S18 acetylase RimI-like enzyme
MLGLVDNTLLQLRTLRYDGSTVDPADLAEATAMVLAHERAVLVEPDSTTDDVAGMLATPSMDRDASCFLLDADGSVVGFLWLEKDPYEAVTGVEAFAYPGPRSSEVRSRALALGIEAARRHREESGVATWKARGGCYVDDVDAAADLAAVGMTPVRRFYRMRIDSDSPLIPDTMPPLPAGVEIVIRDDDETRRLVHDVDNTSFSEHWGWADYPYADWWEHWAARTSRDPEGWWLVTVDGAPAAICLLDDARAEFNEGYVSVLGVLKEFRGRGLAQLLLRRAFVHYRELGRRATALGVDATNTTGAVALYEKVGMSAVLVMEAFEHDLA